MFCSSIRRVTDLDVFFIHTVTLGQCHNRVWLVLHGPVDGVDWAYDFLLDHLYNKWNRNNTRKSVPVATSFCPSPIFNDHSRFRVFRVIFKRCWCWMLDWIYPIWPWPWINMSLNEMNERLSAAAPTGTATYHTCLLSLVGGEGKWTRAAVVVEEGVYVDSLFLYLNLNFDFESTDQSIDNPLSC